MQALARLSRFVGNTFALWVLLFAVLAFFAPAQFKWIGPYIVPLLGLIMFGMGLTLSKEDFREVLKRPVDVAIGVAGQFVIMPGLVAQHRSATAARNCRGRDSGRLLPQGARHPT